MDGGPFRSALAKARYCQLGGDRSGVVAVELQLCVAEGPRGAVDAFRSGKHRLNSTRLDERRCTEGADTKLAGRFALSFVIAPQHTEGIGGHTARTER